MLVAAKVLKRDDRDGKDDFIQEASIMAQVPQHDNIVSLVGVVTKGVLYRIYTLTILLPFCVFKRKHIFFEIYACRRAMVTTCVVL